MIPERGTTIEPYDLQPDPVARLKHYLMQEWAEEVLARGGFSLPDTAIELLKEYKSMLLEMNKI